MEEYKVVKDEQKVRVGLWDKMIYIALVALGAVASLFVLTGESCFGWEMAYRTDSTRVSRKVIQFAGDLLTFVGFGLVLYWSRTGALSHRK
jgi:hypothetical protein